MKSHLVLPFWFWLGPGTTCHVGLKGAKNIWRSIRHLVLESSINKNHMGEKY